MTKPAPSSLRTMRTLVKRLGGWVAGASEELPEKLSKARVSAATAFITGLRRFNVSLIYQPKK